MVTTAEPVWAWLQAVLLASLTLTSAYVKVPAVTVDAAKVTLLPEEVEMISLLPPLIVYVKVYGAVPLAPVKVIYGNAVF
jgi:hypothetical protein